MESQSSNGETDQVLQVGVKAIIRDQSDNTFLVLKRNADVYGALNESWDIPGGRIEFGEPPEIGLRRELNEEIGRSLDSKINIQILDADNIVANKSRQIIRITYLIDVAEKFTPQLSNEHINYQWIELTQSTKFHPLLNRAIKNV